jgi:molybdenum cofactor cytidylyltransferase
MSSEAFVTALVLAAGGSRRLGEPKQLLPLGDSTVLGTVLDVVRTCSLDQRLCVIGGAAGRVRGAVDLTGFDVVENPSFGEGCSSSIAAALRAVDVRAQTLVLILGDQPGLSPASVAALVTGRGEAPIAACRYEDGRGHPLAFDRSLFGELASMHGDKAVWKLMDRHASRVVEVPLAGLIPRDVDTREDYDRLLAERSRPSSSPTTRGGSRMPGSDAVGPPRSDAGRA